MVGLGATEKRLSRATPRPTCVRDKNGNAKSLELFEQSNQPSDLPALRPRNTDAAAAVREAEQAWRHYRRRLGNVVMLGGYGRIYGGDHD